MKKVRRIVTGEDEAGNSRIISTDDIVPVSTAGIDLFPLWGISSLPVPLPATGFETPGNALGAGIVRTALGVIPPHMLVGSDDQGHLHFDADGFHRTDSVDVAYVISGSITMRVPGHADTMLNTGDCIVQNGAFHAWHNEGEEPATILWVWIKGERSADHRAS